MYAYGTFNENLKQRRVTPPGNTATPNSQDHPNPLISPSPHLLDSLECSRAGKNQQFSKKGLCNRKGNDGHKQPNTSASGRGRSRRDAALTNRDAGQVMLAHCLGCFCCFYVNSAPNTPQLFSPCYPLTLTGALLSNWRYELLSRVPISVGKCSKQRWQVVGALK